MPAEYYNRTGGPISVSLKNGESGYVVSKGVLTLTDDQDRSADLLAKVRKGLLVPLRRSNGVAKAESLKEQKKGVPVRAEAAKAVSAVTPKVGDTESLEKVNQAASSTLPEPKEEQAQPSDLEDFLADHEDGAKKLSRRGGKRRNKRS